VRLRLDWIAFCLRVTGCALTGCAALIAAASAFGMGWPGQALYFISSRDGQYRIYAHDLDHHFTRRLSSEPVALSYLNLSPDGRTLLFEAGTERSAWPLGAHLMNWDGSGTRPFPIEDAHGLRWSPDGRWIVATRVVDEQNVLFLVEAACVVGDSACPEPIQITAGTYSAATPSWSPDGEQIAVFGERLYVMDVPGGVPRVLEERAGSWPVWSPDGERIAYVSGLELLSPHIRLVDLAGEGQVLFEDDGFTYWAPVWWGGHD
jgi:Tol biopolymer transport system component